MGQEKANCENDCGYWTKNNIASAELLTGIKIY